MERDHTRELTLEEVKPESVERAERREREHKRGDDFWVWNSDPSRMPARKERAS